MKNKLILALLILTLTLISLASCQTNNKTPTYSIDNNGYLIAKYANGDIEIVGTVIPLEDQENQTVENITDVPQTTEKITDTPPINEIGMSAIQFDNNIFKIKFSTNETYDFNLLIKDHKKDIKKIEIIGNKMYITYTDNTTETILL